MYSQAQERSRSYRVRVVVLVVVVRVAAHETTTTTAPLAQTKIHSPAHVGDPTGATTRHWWSTTKSEIRVEHMHDDAVVEFVGGLLVFVVVDVVYVVVFELD